MRRIGILENDNELRQTLNDYLTCVLGEEVVFSCGSYAMLVASVTDVVKPDVILLDIHLDDGSGIEIIPGIKKIFPSCHIIVITGDTEESLILTAIKNGACGYIHKPFDIADIRAALDNVAATGSFMNSSSLTMLMSVLRTKKDSMTPKLDPGLTIVEKKVLQLVKKGYSYKEMAADLGVSFHTINFHLKSIYIKYDVNSKSELIAKFL